MSGAAAGVRWTRWRRAVQLAVAAFYLGLPSLGATWLAGTLAALRIGPVDLVDPAAVLSAALAAGALPAVAAVGAAPVIALALALGPVSCSWACPWGLLSEGVDRLRGRGAPPPPPRPRLRAAVLAALLALSAVLGAPLAAVLSPPRLATALPLEAVCARVIPWVTAGLVAALLLVEVLGPRRVVCRVLCPAGTLTAILRRTFTWGPRFTVSECRCAEPAPCRQVCPWGLDPRNLAPRDGCTSCMACVARCPSGALTALRRR